MPHAKFQRSTWGKAKKTVYKIPGGVGRIACTPSVGYFPRCTCGVWTFPANKGPHIGPLYSPSIHSPKDWRNVFNKNISIHKCYNGSILAYFGMLTRQYSVLYIANQNSTTDKFVCIAVVMAKRQYTRSEEHT